jgi:hypothetical protein
LRAGLGLKAQLSYLRITTHLPLNILYSAGFDNITKGNNIKEDLKNISIYRQIEDYNKRIEQIENDCKELDRKYKQTLER